MSWNGATISRYRPPPDPTFRDLRATQPGRVKVISDNPKHAAEEVTLSEIEIVGKVLCCLKFAWSPIR
jgi:hypothetical protein